MSLKFPVAETTARFTPEQIAGRKWAYSDGGPLNIPADAPKTLTEALLRTAERFPTHGVRYVQADRSEDFQSYPQLLSEARTILAGLRAQGLKQGDRVILQCENLRDHFTAFWGAVLGGITPVTVAVAPSYEERNGVVNKLFNIWQLLDNPPIITNRRLVPALSNLPRVAGMDGMRLYQVEDLRQNAPAADIYTAKPSDLVFFQLTSGSTGVPKCIQEIHSAIIAHVHGSQQYNDYTSDDVVMNWLPVDHVVPILTVHLRDVYLGCNEIQTKSDLVLADPLAWLDLIQAHRVTHTWAPNFAFKLVADRLKEAKNRQWDLSSVKFFMNAGEQVTLPVITDFLNETKRFGVPQQAMQPSFGMAEVCTCMTYTNDYSPATAALRFTKASLTSLLEPCAANDAAGVTFIDLGGPVPGIEIRITDNQNKLVPEGVIGRFQIRGASVTPGYLKNPSANADAFVGDGWFNSGDIGFILNGRLTLTGREKEMIIVRGANFYCYEIEDVVNTVAGVEPTFTGSCAVHDEATGTEGLAIFFVPKIHPADMTVPSDDPAWPQLVQLVREIKTRVAANLGISPLVVLPLTKKTFPKTTSGKIQRSWMKKGFEAGEYRATVEALAAKSGSTKKAARTDQEQKVLAVWQQALARPDIGVEDNFFEIGGNSLLAVQLTARIRQAFDVDLPLSALFGDANSVAGMSRLITQHAASGSRSAAITRRPANAAVPLTPSQERIWLLEQMGSGPAVYNVGLVAKLAGPFDAERLRAALETVSNRHEALRTSYKWQGGSVTQHTLPTLAVKLPVEDATAISKDRIVAHVLQRAKEETEARFDLEQAPLWRARVFQAAPHENYLALTFHQTVTDVWSLQNFLRDLSAALEDGSLPELPIQFADYAFWQRVRHESGETARELDYWKNQLANPPATFEAVTPDFPRKEKQTFSGNIIPQQLDPGLAEQIRVTARKQGATYFMAIMAAYQAFLSQRTGARDILVGSALAGRSRVETERAIGFFVNTVVLRNRFADRATFATTLEETKQQILGAHAHPDLPFEKLLETLKPQRTANRPALFQNWLSAWEPLPELQAGPLKIEPLNLWTSGAQYDVSVFVKDCEKSPTLYWEYNTDLFKRETIERLTEQFTAFLKAVTANPDAPLPEVERAPAAPQTKAPKLGEVRRKRVAAVA